MRTSILGIGTALPRYSLTQDQALGYAVALACRNNRQKEVLGELYRRTNIEFRSSVLADAAYGDAQPFFTKPNDDFAGPGTAERMARYERESVPLAVQSACKALSAASTGTDEITHLITVSCTGFVAPGFDIALIRNLPLPPGTSRVHLGFMGCHGFINALKLAKDICAGNHAARILICAAELCTLHFQYAWTNHNAVANSLFADGAAAAVLGARSDESPPGIGTIIGGSSIVLADSLNDMTWRIGDHGFSMSLTRKVPALIEENLSAWMEAWLAQHQLTAKEVRGWAVHPGGPKILDAVQQSLNLYSSDLHESREVLRTCGNMSSPTILFVLDKLMERGSYLPCVLLGFGPGLAIEAVLIA